MSEKGGGLYDSPALRKIGKRGSSAKGRSSTARSNEQAKSGSASNATSEATSAGGSRASTYEDHRAAFLLRVQSVGWTQVNCGFLCGKDWNTARPIDGPYADGKSRFIKRGAGDAYRSRSEELRLDTS